ncbi:uncharacterized protein LOC144479907 isoform X2 [Mustelus asterias]
MKIFVIALMLFVLKAEARVLPDVSEDTPTRHESTSIFVAPHGPINMQNLSGIFKHVAENITSLTRKLQERMQTLQTSLSNQAEKIKEPLSSLLQEMQRPDVDISKLTMPSITQQLEMLRRNISQLQMNIGPIQLNQTSGERMRQELSEGMEQLQQIFSPLLQFFHGTVTEGVENLKKSVGPGVHEIRRLVALSESKDTTLEAP